MTNQESFIKNVSNFATIKVQNQGIVISNFRSGQSLGTIQFKLTNSMGDTFIPSTATEKSTYSIIAQVSES